MRQWGSYKAWRLAASLGAVVALGASSSAHAADFSVTNLNSTGAGSLRKAVNDSNNGTGPDRIFFQPGLSGSIPVPNRLQIDEALEILGPGPKTISLVGAGTQTVIEINVPQGTDVAIAGLTVTAGEGGVFSRGSDLTISDSVIAANSGPAGTLGGGGILFQSAAGFRAGVTLLIVNSTIANNSAPGTSGGGISAIYSDTVIQSSTISGNTATFGGGVAASGGLSIQNSTIAGNSGLRGSGGSPGTGGGIYWSNAYCGPSGGCPPGMDPSPRAPNAPLSNTIVADNNAEVSSAVHSAFSVPFIAGFSLIEGSTSAGAVPP